MSRPLTPKQLRFVDEYLTDLDATNAARRAGYSGRTVKVTAFRLLQQPAIAAAIAERQAARARRVQLTADDVLAGLHVEATFCGEGSSHAARVSAWSWIGKHLAMFVDKVETTDKTLEAYLRERAARRGAA